MTVRLLASVTSLPIFRVVTLSGLIDPGERPIAPGGGAGFADRTGA
ncbi:hypothetical protein [Streptomyces sp. NBC_01236]|nr:hypothetical protein OG324_48640 [Streptomyces sp. NBC_01236]